MTFSENYKLTTIIDNKLIADNTYLLSFRRFFDFKPGQWVALKINIEESPRLYSIAGGTNSKIVEILYDVKPDGFLTRKMELLKKGDNIYISEPSGEFLCESGEGWFIATGTGISPFRSMILSGLGEGKKLLYGARTHSHFYFDDEFSEFFGNKYIRCCSGELSNNSFNGRVTDFIRINSNFNVDEKYYLCGKSEMIVEVRDLLLVRNISFQNIIAEIYF